jgi:hypothetical protein
LRRCNEAIPEMPGAMQKEQTMKRVHKIIAGAAGTLALVAAAFAAAPESGRRHARRRNGIHVRAEP